jgi:hypothetical protein
MRRSFTMIVLVVAIGGWTPPGLLAQGQTPPRQQVVPEDSQRLRGFVVTLALGEIEAGKTAGTFTPAATKALADLKDFLPYKSYRVLDTVWTLGLNGPHQFLRGLDGQKHEFYMRSSIVSATAIRVEMLRLWDVPPPAPGPASAPVLIDTDFAVNIGETVVVGTSRVDSTRGLILLVTAAPR